MPWFAHSLEGHPEADWETQIQHGRAVAAAARARAGKFSHRP